MAICGKCGKDQSVEEIRQCYGALPDAPVRYREDEDFPEEHSYQVEDRGENFFLRDSNINLYNSRKIEDEIAEEQRRHYELEQEHPGHKTWSKDSSNTHQFANTNDEERKYLHVPFAEKDAAKRLGARWDPEKKQWWCTQWSYDNNPQRWAAWDGSAGTMAPPSSSVARQEPKQVAKSEFGDIPNGHYAILEYAPVEGMENVIDEDGKPVMEPTWKFYKVNQGKEGSKWEGFTFLDIQAGDDYHPIRNVSHKTLILSTIQGNPEKAMADYGLQLGACGVCMRTLTNPESIERGIGPKCAMKMGW